MNPLKQFLKPNKIELRARTCSDRATAQKLIKKADKVKQKLKGSR